MFESFKTEKYETKFVRKNELAKNAFMAKLNIYYFEIKKKDNKLYLFKNRFTLFIWKPPI